jgi:sugar lactone lactonase YvrE
MAHLGHLATVVATLFLSASAATLRGLPSNGGIHSVSTSLKYLISSYPSIKTVAYTHLPDTVWRPLFIGNVSNPAGVVADPLNGRLYVADIDLNKIFWYQLIIEPDGLLKTDGLQHVAVNDVTAYWMTVDGVGDLYFTGSLVGGIPMGDASRRSVFRMDIAKIDKGDALNPKEVYSQANSGYPFPKVQMPSGIAVDSFGIYWGNAQNGTSNGAVCSGTRQNIGATTFDLNVLTTAVNEVRGVALAGEGVFWLTPQGIYGADKMGSGVTITDPSFGLVQSSPNFDGWDPKSLAFDGENTMYWTETKTGVIYQFPVGDTNPHPLNKYIDAPQVYGVTVYAMTGETKKQADTSYGEIPKSQSNAEALSQSSARADESGALANLRLSMPAALLCAVLALVV